MSCRWGGVARVSGSWDIDGGCLRDVAGSVDM